MDLRTLQVALKAQKLLKGRPDGDHGPDTVQAVNALLKREKVTGYQKWPQSRKDLAAKQLICQLKGIDAGEIDGLMGPSTLQAFEEFAGRKVTREDIEKQNADTLVVRPPPRSPFPKYKDMTKYYGAVGKNQTIIRPRWPMVLAWDQDKPVKGISVHQKAATSAGNALDKIRKAYTDQQLRELGLHLFGGSLNVRKMRGGKQWSTHSWGTAIDFDPIRNQLKWGRDKARLAKPDAKEFWEAWESEGWVSLGRRKNYDWMHVQAVEL
jgi:peptidoglycan hydrolase-like protein with peptidoglycan-binding domain